MDGRRSPRRDRSAVAAMVLAVAGLLAACDYVEIDGVGTRTPDEAHPPQGDVTSFTAL